MPSPTQNTPPPTPAANDTGVVLPPADETLYRPDGLELTRLLQIIRHEPGGRPGDCYRTAIACLLGCASPDQAPHFTEQVDALPDIDPDYAGWEAYALARRWLRASRDLDIFPLVLNAAADTGWPYIASVRSRRGPWGHVVIAQGTEVIHDPSQHLIAADGLAPYTWADVATEAGTADVIVLPYNPDPDAQLSAWRSSEADS